MRDYYEQQLESLLTHVIDLSNICQDALDDCMVYIENNDKTLYDKIMMYRQYSSSHKQSIESLCYQLILHQQPVASDLRLVSSALKIVSDLDRISEQVLDIAQLGEQVGIINATIRKSVMTMFAAVENLFSDCIEAYTNRDVDASFAVMNRDDDVDASFHTIKDLLVEGIRNSDKEAEAYIDVLLIIKYLEKIADHVVNIAGQTIFTITAKPIDVYEDTHS